MTAFGKHGARCDKCGRISSDEQGSYVDAATGRGGNITSHGRSCEHDFCDACDAKLYPSGACSKCGAMPDGATKEMLAARVQQLQGDIDHENRWYEAHRHLWTRSSTKMHDEIIADLRRQLVAIRGAMGKTAPTEGTER